MYIPPYAVEDPNPATVEELRELARSAGLRLLHPRSLVMSTRWWCGFSFTMLFLAKRVRLLMRMRMHGHRLPLEIADHIVRMWRREQFACIHLIEECPRCYNFRCALCHRVNLKLYGAQCKCDRLRSSQRLLVARESRASDRCVLVIAAPSPGWAPAGGRVFRLLP